MIAWITSRSSWNVGDGAAVPTRCLEAFNPSVYPRASDVEVDLTTVQSDFFQKSGASAAVVGAGGFLMPSLLAFLHALLHAKPARPVVVWGVGSNYPMDLQGPEYPHWLGNATLIGLRDIGSPYQWTPCPSCLHPGLRRSRAKTRRVVVYEHRENPLPTKLGFPWIANDAPGGLDEVLDFLGSAEVVVTNSYHGAYWGTLLGARVVVANPFSTKFGRLPWSPPVWTVDLGRLEDRIEAAERRPDAIEQCIERTLSFWSSAKEYLRA